MDTKRRAPGSGSIYQRGRDGLWIARFELGGEPRRRKTYAAKTREKLLARLEEMGIDWESGQGSAPGRLAHMEIARKAGTHTEREWDLVCRRVKSCRYCDVRLSVFNDAKDHVVPVSRGGSDAIDNLQRICWACNMARGNAPADEYAYEGPRPRPFTPKPHMRETYERVMFHSPAARERDRKRLSAKK